MSDRLWLAILSSSLISGVLSALILGAYSLRAKRHEYVHDYYKNIIARRIAAYQQLEGLIIALKTAVIDEDKKPYHILFAKESDWQSAYEVLGNVMAHALWLSDEAFEKTRELNYQIFHLKPNDQSVIEFGKANYQAIAELRSDLERIVAADMLELHNVEKFLKAKKKKEWGFHGVQFVDPAGRMVER